MGGSVGYQTFYGPRGSSSIDYILVSENLLHTFDFINVMLSTGLSDRCVVCSTMLIDTSIMEKMTLIVNSVKYLVNLL